MSKLYRALVYFFAFAFCCSFAFAGESGEGVAIDMNKDAPKQVTKPVKPVTDDENGIQGDEQTSDEQDEDDDSDDESDDDDEE